MPCVSGTYQDMEGQLGCTPCPSSEGLGLAGARNVSECGGKYGLPEGEGWVETSSGQGPLALHKAPQAKANAMCGYKL